MTPIWRESTITNRESSHSGVGMSCRRLFPQTRGALVRGAWTGGALLALALACAAPPAPTAPEEPELPSFCATTLDARAGMTNGQTGFLTEPEEADIMARLVPGGFGGHYHAMTPPSAAGPLVVLLKEPELASEAVGLVKAVLACGSAYPGWLDVMLDTTNIQVHAAQFDASELLAWLRALEPLREHPGVWALDLDVARNRIWIGLEDQDDREDVALAVAQVSVPLSAVLLEAPPPADEDVPFEILEDNVTVSPRALLGRFDGLMHARYVNRTQAPRYPGPCVIPVVQLVHFDFALAQWDGEAWVPVFRTLCALVALPPQPVEPGGERTDSIPFAFARGVRAAPKWATARITGTYRFEGLVYRATTAEVPYLADLAPLEERVSAPFRVVVGPVVP